MDLLQLESKYQKLTQTISSSYSARYKILLLVDFLTELGDALPAYAYELTPILCNTINKTDFSFTNLSFLIKIEQTLAGLEKVLIGTYLSNDINKAKDIITNEITAKRILVDDKNTDISDYIVGRKKLFGKSTTSKLRKESSVSIPMVESEPLIKTDKPYFATVSKLTIELKKLPKNSQKDAIEFPNILNGNANSQDHYLELVVLAKKLFVENSGKKETNNFFIRYNLDNSNLVQGESLDIAFTLLATANLFKYYDCRNVIEPSELTAFTGRLDKDGNMLSIDEDGLALKIEAAAFSDYKYLVVPVEQEQFCKRHLEEIEKQNNAKNLLTIIALQNINECFYDRRILELAQISFSVHTVKKIWKRRRPVTAILFLAMALFIAHVIYGPIDKHPYKITYKEKYLNVDSYLGETINSIDIGVANAGRAINMNEEGWKFAGLCNADNDEYKDLIYLERDKDSNGFGTILCKSIHLNKIIWQHPLREKISMPKAAVGDDRFSFWNLEIGDYDKDGKEEVYILCKNSDDPCLLLKLDAKNGKEIGSYLHIGHLNKMRILDLDGDGNYEILCCGINQAYDSACLVVLDPKKIYGHSPTFGRYIVNDWIEANEKKYVLIPKTIAGKYYKTSAYNSANDLAIPDDKTIKIYFNDTNLNFYGGTGLFYTITFNNHLEPLQFVPHDFYNSHAQIMYDEGNIKTYPDQAYFSQYLKTIVRLK